ncbi:DUF6443 domain-containing protein [Marinoscillum sp.]|uniref:DUF6443 domain-containing protein n=1 Tax=Marinoscillum sp. TaxID=2024838 RepID=UPI003BAA39FA
MSVTLSILAQTSDRNFITTHTARIKVPANDLAAVNNQDQVNRSTQYFDGLGRPTQSIINKGAPDDKDVITQVTYDALGRQTKVYLPYTNGTTGNYRSSWFSEIDDFYDGTWSNDVVDEPTYYYNETVYESSPLNRPVKAYGPGNVWRSADKFIQYGYTPYDASNPEHALVRFGVSRNAAQTISQHGAYTDGDLWVKEVTDENGNSSLTFTDNLGQMIAKKSEIGSSYATTYYLYDDLGQLTFVIQPEGVAEIGGGYSSLLNTSEFRKKWMFRYKYDGRGRMTEKQVPGTEPVFMIYDSRDRLVLTQDGNQRVEAISSGNVTLQGYNGKSYKVTGSGSLTLEAGVHILPSTTTPFEASATAANRYTFTKYDDLDRPVMTGICSITDNISTIRANADAYGGGETRNSGSHGYTTSNTYPNANSSTITFDQVLSVTYYDDYSHHNQSYFDLNNWSYVDTGADFEDNENVEVKGLVTGTKTKVLGSNEYLFASSYYDDRYRTIQSISTNIHGGTDRVSNSYNFTGTIKKSIREHDGDEDVNVTEGFNYDHMDRLISSTHKVNGQSTVTMQNNSYNELGELKEKNIGNNVQSIDYKYNIRGWLTHLNNGTAFDDASDKFGMELQYQNTPTAQYKQYNGNIGRILWKTSGNSRGNQNYSYAYDKLNRLLKATYGSQYGSGVFDVYSTVGGNIQYDLNGNIQDLVRTAPSTGTEDVLHYDYNGNQLTSVGDSGTSALFDEQSDGNAANEYLYDQNGNMISDANKAITSISYNNLNLPEFVKTPVGTIQYIYDAAGTKLRKYYDKNSGADETTDYLGGIHYKDGALDFIQHAEGRARKSGSSFAYEYNLTDHLGNVRVTVNSAGTVVQRDDYYPFGGTFNSYVSGQENLYKFNGMEEQKSTGWYDFGARMQDPWLGRWFAIDPMAEKYHDWSPYNFTMNNPILFIDPTGMEGENSNDSTETESTTEIIPTPYEDPNAVAESFKQGLQQGATNGLFLSSESGDYVIVIGDDGVAYYVHGSLVSTDANGNTVVDMSKAGLAYVSGLQTGEIFGAFLAIPVGEGAGITVSGALKALNKGLASAYLRATGQSGNFASVEGFSLGTGNNGYIYHSSEGAARNGRWVAGTRYGSPTEATGNLALDYPGSTNGAQNAYSTNRVGLYVKGTAAGQIRSAGGGTQYMGVGKVFKNAKIIQIGY